MASPHSRVGDTLQSDRSTLRRRRERGRYERSAVTSILDEGLICHVGFSVDGAPFLLPMAYARIDDDLYLHGATGNRMLRALADGTPACVAVTIVDGIVFARSAFHHSMNYRSAVLFGQGTRVTDLDEMSRAADALVDHLAPGRKGDTRPPSIEELSATLIVRFPIDEGSAKVREGDPVDDESDLGLRYWAGHLPISLVAGTPVPAADLAAGIELPGYVAHAIDRPRPVR